MTSAADAIVKSLKENHDIWSSEGMSVEAKA